MLFWVTGLKGIDMWPCSPQQCFVIMSTQMMLLNYGEDSWESLELQGVQPVSPKENQSWIFIGRTNAEAEAPVIWPPDAKNWLIGKEPDAGKDWRQEEKGTTEDEMVGWHHLLNGRVWISSGSWWWTGKPGMLQSMGSQRVGHDWATVLNWLWSDVISEVGWG